MPETKAPTKYLSCAETAKLVRAALKAAFPGVKFSVRSDTYSGGASIDVKWADGPTSREVEAVAKAYQGADFDGMVDGKTYNSHYLLDGRVMLRHAQGSVSYQEVNNQDFDALMEAQGAERVHFGADFVMCERRITNETELRAECTAWAYEYLDGIEGTGAAARFGNDWLDALVSRLVYGRREGESWAEAFQRGAGYRG